MKEIKITSLQENQTIFKFVKKYLSNAPLSFIEKIFRKKDVKVNGKRVDKSFVIKENDLIQIYITDSQIDEFNKQNEINITNMKPNIIYEDENILICNKPSGLLVHKGSKENEITLVDIVLNYLAFKGEYDKNNSQGFIPGLAHRIDRNTSGIVLFGKNVRSLQELEHAFKERNSISKFYLALVNGRIKEGGIIDKPLYKDEKNGIVSIKSLQNGGKTAITKYQVEEIFEKYTLVNVELLTGRTHQIRVHFASINHPLLGDSKYGDFIENKEFKKIYKYENQFLHAHKIRFHNLQGILSYLNDKEFVASLGNKEKQIIDKLRNWKEELYEKYW